MFAKGATTRSSSLYFQCSDSHLLIWQIFVMCAEGGFVLGLLPQQDMARAERDGPADDDDVDDELGEREPQVEGALGAAGERKDDEKHHGEDGDAVESSGDEWVLEQEGQAKAREHIDGRDDTCNEEVEGEAEGAGAPAFFEGRRSQDAAGHALKDALRRHADRCSLRGGGYGVEDAADERGHEDCPKGVGHERS